MPAAKTSKKTKAESEAAANVADTGHAVGSEAAYQRYSSEAQALDKSEVLPYRLDPVLAYHNVMVGVTEVGAREAELRRALPLLDLRKVLDLPALCQAVLFSDTQVDGRQTSTGETRTLIAEASELRGRLLTTADALVLAKVLPAASVKKIRAGRGLIDMAQDCIELAALYRKHPEVMKQQKMVLAKDLERASELGTILVGRLKPSSVKTPSGGKNAMAEARDRLATLLVRGHRDLRRAGYWLWPDDLEAHVPPLQARKQKRAAKKAPAGGDKPA